MGRELALSVPSLKQAPPELPKRIELKGQRRLSPKRPQQKRTQRPQTAGGFSRTAQTIQIIPKEDEIFEKNKVEYAIVSYQQESDRENKERKIRKKKKHRKRPRSAITSSVKVDDDELFPSNFFIEQKSSKEPLGPEHIFLMQRKARNLLLHLRSQNVKTKSSPITDFISSDSNVEDKQRHRDNRENQDAKDEESDDEVDPLRKEKNLALRKLTKNIANMRNIYDNLRASRLEWDRKRDLAFDRLNEAAVNANKNDESLVALLRTKEKLLRSVAEREEETKFMKKRLLTLEMMYKRAKHHTYLRNLRVSELETTNKNIKENEEEILTLSKATVRECDHVIEKKKQIYKSITSEKKKNKAKIKSVKRSLNKTEKLIKVMASRDENRKLIREKVKRERKFTSIISLETKLKNQQLQRIAAMLSQSPKSSSQKQCLGNKFYSMEDISKILRGIKSNDFSGNNTTQVSTPQQLVEWTITSDHATKHIQKTKEETEHVLEKLIARKAVLQTKMSAIGQGLYSYKYILRKGSLDERQTELAKAESELKRSCETLHKLKTMMIALSLAIESLYAKSKCIRLDEDWILKMDPSLAVVPSFAAAYSQENILSMGSNLASCCEKCNIPDCQRCVFAAKISNLPKTLLQVRDIMSCLVKICDEANSREKIKNFNMRKLFNKGSKTNFSSKGNVNDAELETKLEFSTAAESIYSQQKALKSDKTVMNYMTMKEPDSTENIRVDSTRIRNFRLGENELGEGYSANVEALKFLFRFGTSAEEKSKVEEKRDNIKKDGEIRRTPERGRVKKHTDFNKRMFGSMVANKMKDKVSNAELDSFLQLRKEFRDERVDMIKKIKEDKKRSNARDTKAYRQKEMCSQLSKGNPMKSKNQVGNFKEGSNITADKKFSTTDSYKVRSNVNSSRRRMNTLSRRKKSLK